MFAGGGFQEDFSGGGGGGGLFLDFRRIYGYLSKSLKTSSEKPTFRRVLCPRNGFLPLDAVSRSMPSPPKKCLGSAKWERLKGRNGSLSKIFADFLQIWSLICKVRGLEPQKTVENRRKPQETAENRRKQFQPLSPI